MNETISVTKEVKIGRNVIAGGTNPLTIIAGPCVIRSLEHCLMIAETILEMCEKVGFNYVFKASYDKANRTGANAYRGPGLERGLEILATVREKTGVDVLTDIHTEEQCAAAAKVADILGAGISLQANGSACSVQKRETCQCEKRTIHGSVGHEECLR